MDELKPIEVIMRIYYAPSKYGNGPELLAHVKKVQELVRCRECRFGHLCIIGQHLGLDGFCSKGEREVQE